MTAYIIVNRLSYRSIDPEPYRNMLDKNIDKICE